VTTAFSWFFSKFAVVEFQLSKINFLYWSLAEIQGNASLKVAQPFSFSDVEEGGRSS
jgi:hypothetical protein